MNIIKNILKNQYITTIISIVLLLFSATVNRYINQKPTFITNQHGKHFLLKFYTTIFNHHFFRLAYLLIIIYIFNYDVKIALSLSIVFLMMNILITNNMAKKSFGQFENFIELEHFTDEYKYSK